jgi:hypothetical protein
VVPAPAVTDAPLIAPGQSGDVALELAAPTSRGEYLVLLDVLGPDGVSLAAMGVPPHVVRVTVHPRDVTARTNKRQPEATVRTQIVRR